MEVILILIFIFFGGVIIKGLGAGAKSAVTGKSLKESYRGLDDFKVRFNDTILEGGVLRKNVQIKGLIPVSYSTNVAVCISAFDVTEEGTKAPIISFLDFMQEPGSPIFRHTNKIGKIDSGSGFKDWVDVLGIAPSFIQTPKSGKRKIEVLFYMYNSLQPPKIQLGLIDPEEVDKLLFFKSLTFNHEFIDKGYEEISKDVEEANELTIKIAMAVAMSDGSLDDKEGLVIKEWVQKTISLYKGDRKEKLKKLYNNAIKSGHDLAVSGKLSLAKLTKRLHEINEQKTKYDTLELCYEVMAADGVAEDKELKVIRRIADTLKLDLEEVNKMRDKSLINLKEGATKKSSLEELLGIDASWDKKKINAHLLKEFTKWNNRLITLSEGKERQNAQKMLENIADLRKKYGS